MIAVMRAGALDQARTWGWFPTLREAEELVLRNATDIFEGGSYNIAVIEEVPFGLCITAGQKQWYQTKGQSGDNLQVLKMDQPEWALGLINFAIG